MSGALDQAHESLKRATENTSTANYDAIYVGFQEKGISHDQIIPRVNVLTFNAWKAKDRCVIKGEHGVKVLTYVPCEDKYTDPVTGEVTKENYEKKTTTTVFHISQTREMTADEIEQFRQQKPRKTRRAWRGKRKAK